MTDLPPLPEPRGGDPFGRLRRHRLTLLLAALLAILAVVVFAVPPLAAALVLIAFAVTLLIETRPSLPVAAGRRLTAGGSVWPDTGMKAILDALDDACFLTDAAGILRYQNRAASERFGPPRPGDPIAFKLRMPELLAAVERAGRGERTEPLRITERVPTERQTLAAISPIRGQRRDGARPGSRADFVLVRLHDETDLMRMERMRGDFIANASHELRTPLASLTGFIETLLGPARSDEVNRERFLKIMLEQAGRMARLIDDLLSLSRIEMRAHVRPDAAVDLAAVVAHAVDVLGPVARDNGATIALAGTAAPVLVRGDRDELIQVTTNLVENAIKYGREGGRVDVALARETAADGTRAVVLTVKDDGPGIPPEHLPRLTERFYRVDADHSRRQKGTGLGLAIVKHIVNRHRGRLAIRSTPGEGTAVTVKLDDTETGKSA